MFPMFLDDGMYSICLRFNHAILWQNDAVITFSSYNISNQTQNHFDVVQIYFSKFQQCLIICRVVFYHQNVNHFIHLWSDFILNFQAYQMYIFFYQVYYIFDVNHWINNIASVLQLIPWILKWLSINCKSKSFLFFFLFDFEWLGRGFT